MAVPSEKSINRWAARIIPLTLAGIVGYTTWVVVVLLSVDYLLKGSTTANRHPRYGAAITVLALYFLLLCIMSISYARLLQTVLLNPGFVPRGHSQVQHREKSADWRYQNGTILEKPAPTKKGDDFRSKRYTEGGDSLETSDIDMHTMQDIQASDFPVSNLAEFYSKEAFVCETDARPPWCSRCLVFKPDRTHHCSEVDRCVRKMDHFCPWVGGVIGETSFKFFIQFLGYATMFCVFILIITAIFVAETLKQKRQVNSHWIILLILSGLFSFLTAGMAGSSIWLALSNLTTIENLTRKTKVWQFAVRMPHTSLHLDESGPVSSNSTMAHPTVSESISQAEQEPIRLAARGVPDQPPFAILRTAPGENPWDLGPLENWKDVMGERVRDWFLPIKHSPCCNHNRSDTAFPLGPVFERMKREAGLASRDTVSEISPRKRQRRQSAADSQSNGQIKKEGGKNSEADIGRKRRKRRSSRGGNNNHSKEHRERRIST